MSMSCRSGGAVFVSEDRRPVSLPTGPSAPAAAVTGPTPQAWADASAAEFYAQVPHAVAELISHNNAAWQTNEHLRARRALSTMAEDEYWWRHEGTGGAPPVGYAHDAFSYSQNAGHTLGVGQVNDAVAVASVAGAAVKLGGAGIAAIRAGAAAEEGSLLRRLPAYSGGKTQGILQAGGTETELISGYTGPSSTMPRGTPGMNYRIKSHVEAHAAAILRNESLSEGTLYINRVPCSGPTGCSVMLPRMLPEGAQLRIIGPGGFDEIFVGLPDP